MTKISNYRRTLTPDSPLIQNANYRFDAADRSYIDQQVIDLQTLLGTSLLNRVVATYYLVAEEVTKGDVVCLIPVPTDDPQVGPASTSNLSTAGTITGIAMANAAVGTFVQVAIGGDVTKDITGLTGTHPFVRVSSTGRCEEVAAYTSGDFPVGIVSSTGVLTIAKAVTGAVTIPGALGDLDVTGNVTIGGTLGVTGIASFTQTYCSGDAQIDGNLGVAGDLAVSGLAATQNVEVNNNLSVSGNFEGNLGHFGGGVSVDGLLYGTDGVQCDGGFTTDTITCSGNATVSGTFACSNSSSTPTANAFVKWDSSKRITTDLLTVNTNATCAGSYLVSSRSETRVQSVTPFYSPNNWLVLPNTSTLLCLSTGAQVFYPLDIPHGAVLTAASITIIPTSGHAGLPGSQPFFEIAYQTFSTGGIAVVASTTDAQGTVSAYEARHSITLSMNHTVDKTTRRYFAALQSESGVNAKTGMIVEGVSTTWTRTKVGED